MIVNDFSRFTAYEPRIRAYICLYIEDSRGKLCDTHFTYLRSFMATFELYRRSTIGMCLTETLDEMVSSGILGPELAIQVLVQFDKSMAEALDTQVKTKVSIKHNDFFQIDDVISICKRVGLRIKRKCEDGLLDLEQTGFVVDGYGYDCQIRFLYLMGSSRTAKAGKRALGVPPPP
ncbi:hypothetical protein E3N88_28777 [Mikania micrantha]|uniref:Transcription initiation factor IIA gamma subunit N-terminal domain-containing protein n=1 Tax=Mikania micrantha TaxID=192012 RepID=A0A5N6N1F0_9ASTR|nr:hypothetical protein E3N88_28777 [Mikania micrantha]